MRPLTQEERDGLAGRYLDGDESMICDFQVGCDDGTVFSVYAYPMGTPSGREPGATAHPEGAVWLPELYGDDDRCLTSHDARLFAVALLEAADHAEYGPTA